MHNEATLVDGQLIRKAKSIFRAINHPLRQQILQLLHKHDRMIVKDIYFTLEIEQSLASQQLAILRDAKFVEAKRDGKQVYYSINYKRIREIHDKGGQLLM